MVLAHSLFSFRLLFIVAFPHAIAVHHHHVSFCCVVNHYNETIKLESFASVWPNGMRVSIFIVPFVCVYLCVCFTFICLFLWRTCWRFKKPPTTRKSFQKNYRREIALSFTPANFYRISFILELINIPINKHTCICF